MQRPTRAMVPSGCVCAVLASSSGSVVFTDSGTGRSSPALITGSNSQCGTVSDPGRVQLVCELQEKGESCGRGFDSRPASGADSAVAWH